MSEIMVPRYEFGDLSSLAVCTEWIDWPQPTNEHNEYNE